MAVFLLLVVIIALPAIGVIYFMTHAMENERLVVRQKLSEVYQGDLDAIYQRLQEFWDHRRKETEDLVTGQPPAALFHEIVAKHLCDSVLICNSTGEVVYPVAPTRMADEVALTLRNQAAQLIKSGSKEEAVDILTENLQAPVFRQSADTSGRLVCADALLLALYSLDPQDPHFVTTLDHLKQLLNDYSLTYFPSRQRLFLMSEVRKLTLGIEFPTYSAELLAQAYLESATGSGLWPLGADDPPQPPLPRGEGEQKVPSPHGRGDLGVRLESESVGVRFLFKPEHILYDSRQAISSLLQGPTYQVSLESLQDLHSQPEPFLSLETPAPLVGYRLVLRLIGPDPFEQATQSQILAYGLAGGGVIFVTLIVAVWIAYLLSNQIRLTRLRNDLIATVAHELRTPLASVRLLVDTLLDGRVTGEEATREYLGMISKESRRLSGLIDNFLTFSRMERNKTAFTMETFDPRQLVDEALESLSERFSRPGVQLSVQVNPGLSPILGDRDALVTLLVNLLDNAFKYTGEEKAISLHVSQVDEDIVYEVADNGMGIPRRARKRIFKRFYQVDRSLSREAGGCGLGLAIVDFITRSHQGRIRVESEVGKGSRFIVSLPASMRELDHAGQDTGG